MSRTNLRGRGSFVACQRRSPPVILHAVHWQRRSTAHNGSYVRGAYIVLAQYRSSVCVGGKLMKRIGR